MENQIQNNQETAEQMNEVQEEKEQGNMDKEIMEVEKLWEKYKQEKNLPEIKADDRSVVLLRSENHSICMQMFVKETTQTSEGCSIYMCDKRGIPLLDGTGEISISREKILSASDDNVMRILNRFNLSISEGERRLAFERAKEFIEKTKRPTYVRTTDSIAEIFRRVIERAVAEAVEEESNVELDPADYKYSIDAEGHSIMIKANYFQELLNAVDAGITKVVFCKKLRIIEAAIDETIIISNRNGGTGYGFNSTGNQRYYKFNMETILLKDTN